MNQIKSNLTIEDTHKSNSVKSVDKALSIIDSLSDFDELSLGDISQIMKLDKATSHRLIGTLKNAGYIDQNPLNKKYSLSYKLFEIGNKIIDKKGLRKIAEPFIEDCSRQVGETVNLGIRNKGNIIYIDKIESHETIKVGLHIGKKIPLYCTGLGKVILAFYSKEEFDGIITSSDFIMFTKHTVKDKDQLESQLKRIREDGYFIDNEEYIDGLVCIAAPIFDHQRHPIAAISISVPKYRYDTKENKEEYTELITETAKKISEKFGYKSKI